MAELTEPRDLNSAALLRARVHPSLTGLDGAGTVICIIDYGFDLMHPALRTASGETRFAALIDQNGAHLTRSDINRMLRSASRSGNRTLLDDIYDPHANYFGRAGVEVGAHGSWVASLAAGSTTRTFTGVAPKATLIGIQLDLPDSAWREEDAAGRATWLDLATSDTGDAGALANWDGWRAYEESPAIVAALEDGFAAARALRPDGIVFNLSIGAWAGGHDHASAVNRTIEAIADASRPAAEPFTAIVAGTGNAGVDEGHVSGPVRCNDPLRFAWSFSPDCRTQSKLDIWTDCPGGVMLELAPRFGKRRTIAAIGGLERRTSAIALDDGRVIGVAENREACAAACNHCDCCYTPHFHRLSHSHRAAAHSTS